MDSTKDVVRLVVVARSVIKGHLFSVGVVRPQRFFKAFGINFDNFAQRVVDDMDLVIQAMIGVDGNGGAVGVAKQLADEMGISIDDILEELKTW